jgi:spermidine synthase
LKPAGVFCQWLQLYKISPENLRSILQTFHKIFPHILVFQSTEYDLLILGSFEPLSIDPGTLRARLSQARVREDLGRTEVKSVQDILAHFVFGTQEISSFVQDAPINTDDNALLEYSAPRTLYIDSSEANFKELSQYSRGADEYLRH